MTTRSELPRVRVGSAGGDANAAALRAEHEAFEAMTERLVSEVAEGDRDDVAAVITKLQETVLAHLAGEEGELLPAYAEVYPTEAADLLADHAAIRTRLAELDVATDLRLVRADGLRALLMRLRAHAAKENAGLYAWAAARERGSA